MKPAKTLHWLVPLTALMVVLASAVGVFWQNGGQPFQFTTLHNESVQIYGEGLYRHDMMMIAVGNRIGDTYNLLVGIPFLVISYVLYRRNLMLGVIFLGGGLAFLLYQYSSFAFGAAYNPLFLVYLLIITAAFFGLISIFRSVDLQELQAHFSPHAPLRGAAIFLCVSGIILFLIWLVLSILPALVSGTVPPELGSYTTVVTFVIDMAFLSPCMIASGLLLLRRDSLGTLLVPIMLVFTDVLGLGLMFMGIGQMLLGLISIGQFIGFVVSFAILTFLSTAYSIAVFRHFQLSTDSRG